MSCQFFLLCCLFVVYFQFKILNGHAIKFFFNWLGGMLFSDFCSNLIFKGAESKHNTKIITVWLIFMWFCGFCGFFWDNKYVLDLFKDILNVFLNRVAVMNITYLYMLLWKRFYWNLVRSICFILLDKFMSTFSRKFNLVLIS